MKFLAKRVQQEFKVSEQGEILYFFLGCPWSRALVVPDPQTQQRVFNKRLTIENILAVVAIIVVLQKRIDEQAEMILAILVVFTSSVLINKLVLYSELKHLKQPTHRLSLQNFYGQKAQQASYSELGWDLVVSIVAVVAGVWVALATSAPMFGALVAALGAWGLFVSRWTLILKQQDTSPQGLLDRQCP